MYIGSTPTATFDFTLDFDKCEKVIITFNQNDKTVIEIDKSRLNYDANSKKISFTFTQEETLLFSTNGLIFVQIKVKLDGKVLYSNIVRKAALEVLNAEVI